MPKTKKKGGKKGGKKGATKGKNAVNPKSSQGSNASLTKEEKIEKSISHIQLINDMWEFICTPALTDDERIRENSHKQQCEKLNIKYTPKSCVSFNRFKLIVETMTDIQQKPESKPNCIINSILDIFEWFDMNGSGRISYKDFQNRMGEFLLEENSSKTKSKKSGKVGKKKGGKKGKKKKK